MITEVGWCGCCTDLVCQNGQLVVDPLADWQPVQLFQERLDGSEAPESKYTIYAADICIF